jgi:epoxyqueuosine reductase
VTAGAIRELARACGFELAGVAPAASSPDVARYERWVAAGFAGEMGYLQDHRAALRGDARNLLPAARSVICVGKIYNSPAPYSTDFREPGRAWIARYAWGDDYHDVVRRGLEQLDAMLRQRAANESRAYESRICVDTAPLLERSYARAAGLGWIGKNTCLIDQHEGSWFFLGELLTSLEIEPGAPPPDRCGSCTRCIDACPTSAIAPFGEGGEGGYAIDSRRCISYFTIELRAAIPDAWRAAMGAHVFGCDICQDVCPWNRKAPSTRVEEFQPREGLVNPALEWLAEMDAEQFREQFRGSPIRRTKRTGLRRNAVIAMGNSGDRRFVTVLEKLVADDDPAVAESAGWAMNKLSRIIPD